MQHPLENIYNTIDIRYVVKDGFVYDGGTLDTSGPQPSPSQVIDWKKISPSPFKAN